MTDDELDQMYEELKTGIYDSAATYSPDDEINSRTLAETITEVFTLDGEVATDTIYQLKLFEAKMPQNDYVNFLKRLIRVLDSFYTPIKDRYKVIEVQWSANKVASKTDDLVGDLYYGINLISTALYAELHRVNPKAKVNINTFENIHLDLKDRIYFITKLSSKGLFLDINVFGKGRTVDLLSILFDSSINSFKKPWENQRTYENPAPKEAKYRVEAVEKMLIILNHLIECNTSNMDDEQLKQVKKIEKLADELNEVKLNIQNLIKG